MGVFLHQVEDGPTFQSAAQANGLTTPRSPMVPHLEIASCATREM